MKKLMIAGCSFSAVSDTHPNTAWSEKLADRLGWQLVNLARQGCSNGGVRIQIEEIRRQRPDFAIVTPTFWDRMEIPTRGSQPQDHSGLDLQQHLQDRHSGRGYDPAAGIDNINYGHNDYRMICETIFSLADNNEHRYRRERLDRTTHAAIKYYVDCLYDSNWKKQQDEWIVREGILMMYLDGIDFLVVPPLLWPFDPDLVPTQWRDIFPSLLPDQFIMSNEPESILRVAGNNPHVGPDPGYHSNEHGQELIAQAYYERMSRDFGLGLS